MGYFSNGSEGESFFAHYCSKCVHREGPDGKSGCAVWLAHLLFNYKLCNEKDDEGKQILDLLIPRNERGFNDGCAMFHEGPAVVPDDAPVDVMPSMREWAKKKGLAIK